MDSLEIWCVHSWVVRPAMNAKPGPDTGGLAGLTGRRISMCFHRRCDDDPGGEGSVQLRPVRFHCCIESTWTTAEIVDLFLAGRAAIIPDPNKTPSSSLFFSSSSSSSFFSLSSMQVLAADPRQANQCRLLVVSSKTGGKQSFSSCLTSQGAQTQHTPTVHGRRRRQRRTIQSNRPRTEIEVEGWIRNKMFRHLQDPVDTQLSASIPKRSCEYSKDAAKDT